MTIRQEPLADEQMAELESGFSGQHIERLAAARLRFLESAHQELLAMVKEKDDILDALINSDWSKTSVIDMGILSHDKSEKLLARLAPEQE